MKLVAIDIGNSSINIGFFTEKGLVIQKIKTIPLLPFSEYAGMINEFMKKENIDKMPDGIIISSVVPGHTDAIKKACSALSKKRAHGINS